MILHSLWHESPGQSRIRESELQFEDDGNHLLVRSAWSFISQGTERTVSMGQVPPGIAEQMRVPYQLGEFSMPVCYGYSLVGQVLEGPPSWKGAWVHVMHPHSDWAVVRIQDCSRIPPGVLPASASLVANLETAINAIWDARLQGNERILLLGLGSVNLLTGMLLRGLFEIKPAVQDILRNRLELAASLGFQPRPSAGFGNYDVVFHSAGQSESLQAAIQATGYEGRIIELSWYGTRPVQISLGGSFHYGRKQIIASQVSHIPGHMSHAFDFASRKAQAWDYLERFVQGHVPIQAVPFSEAAGFFDKLRSGPSHNPFCQFDYAG